MKFFLLLILFIALSFAQTPAKPTWPTNFSATILAQPSGRRPDIFRWFYDKHQNKDRIDGFAEWHGEGYFAEIIFDHAAGKETNVFYRENEVTCLTNKINSTIPAPDFSKFRFAGESLLGYERVYHWVAEDKERDFFQVWDRVSDRQIQKIDIMDRKRRESISWTFLELDIGSQNPSLFTIPKTIEGICFSP